MIVVRYCTLAENILLMYFFLYPEGVMTFFVCAFIFMLVFWGRRGLK